MILYRDVDGYNADNELIICSVGERFLQFESRRKVDQRLDWVVVAQISKTYSLSTVWTRTLLNKLTRDVKLQQSLRDKNVAQIAFIAYDLYRMQGEYSCSLCDSNSIVPHDTAIIGTVNGDYLIVEKRNRENLNLVSSDILYLKNSSVSDPRWLRQSLMHCVKEINSGFDDSVLLTHIQSDIFIEPAAPNM